MAEPDRAERRHPQGGRGRLAVPALAAGLDRTEVADAAAGVDLRVGVEHLVPAAGQRQPDPVALVRDRREVGDAGEHRAVVARAEEREHVVARVVGVDPREAGRVGVA